MTLCGRADWVCGSAGTGRGRQRGLVLVFYLFFDFFSGEFYGTVSFCVLLILFYFLARFMPVLAPSFTFLLIKKYLFVLVTGK